MSSRGYRLGEPPELAFPHEQPSLIDALIKNLTERMAYSEEELANVLHLYYDEVAQLYSLRTQAGLRLVK
jgi:hypothetical protein